MRRAATRSGEWAQHFSNASCFKYSLDFLRQIITPEVFEAIDCLADLPQQTWPQASRNLGSGHFCWGSYDGFNFAGWRGGYMVKTLHQLQPNFILP